MSGKCSLKWYVCIYRPTMYVSNGLGGLAALARVPWEMTCFLVGMFCPLANLIQTVNTQAHDRQVWPRIDPPQPLPAGVPWGGGGGGEARSISRIRGGGGGLTLFHGSGTPSLPCGGPPFLRCKHLHRYY